MRKPESESEPYKMRKPKGQSEPQSERKPDAESVYFKTKGKLK